MEAIVCTDFGESTVREVERPDPGPDEVLVAVDRVQLSVTECRLYQGDPIAHHETVRARLEAGDGRLFGHEFCATVVETGAEVGDLAAGDRVYAPGKLPCGSCRYCETGHEEYCPDKRGIGYDLPGALAEFAALPAAPLRAVPDGVSDAACAALQPFASALLCALEADISPGDTVCTVGTGVMGYACGQLALSLGAGTVVAVDVVPAKLDRAADRGLVPVDARESDPVAAVRELTDGVGADVVFEAVGGDQSHGTDGDGPLAGAFRTARNGGTVVQVGHVVGDLTLTPRHLRLRNVDWVNPARGVRQVGPNADTGTLAAALVADDRADIESYVTHELDGLAAFETAVDIGLHPENYDALGPAQLRL
ncbi:zinc-dependent alcohol dehydrogenase [Haloglomus litoreum]|uniref:zinc-dependent alcohol dehydrogenase n=1 Tax=Haloglomus litoreum TaxID=3034026 RepID=UPI0023E7C313|nr:alcohol dehydrogenase catalytic domain-containing protein [Haloglomus sp. DT116]